ncbi:PREDICTED: butyrophilin subfamily 1 member A1-like [Elephantulus edwardii]|uniref:butyrophilin subfamily 1 member A1-like n=1 Tax=Elephantulus edwardii TaxID=28737 RepID=UPI0003F0C4B2|nr:PREDICTED: butyrophilin subfamily 1 member A1-like [Elephantulus edwardii]
MGLQSPEYQGRTEFLKENITKGQVALKIDHVHLSDEGEYSCFFASSTHFNEAQFQLMVTVTGKIPHIHIEHSKTGGFKLTCTSTGWYPKPEMEWRDLQQQNLSPTSEAKITEENGLFHVQTSVTVDESSKGNVSCFIRNPLLHVVKEAHIALSEQANRELDQLAKEYDQVRKENDQIRNEYDKVRKELEQVRNKDEKNGKGLDNINIEHGQNPSAYNNHHSNHHSTAQSKSYQTQNNGYCLIS